MRYALLLLILTSCSSVQPPDLQDYRLRMIGASADCHCALVTMNQGDYALSVFYVKGVAEEQLRIRSVGTVTIEYWRRGGGWEAASMEHAGERARYWLSQVKRREASAMRAELVWGG